MTRYRWNKVTYEFEEVVPINWANVRLGPMVISDTPAYLSPLGTGMIDGRAARREDLARSGCREVDPSEKFSMGASQGPTWLEKHEAADKALDPVMPEFMRKPVG